MPHRVNSSFSIVAIFATLGLLSSCREQGEGDMRFPAGGIAGERPVWAWLDQLDSRRLVFYPEPGADWQSLLDMRLFEGFWPGMRLSDAHREFGDPQQEGNDDWGHYWIYERSLGTVRIAHEKTGSTLMPWRRWWRLKGYPKSTSVQSVFHPNVARHIPTDRDNLEITVMNNHGSPGLFAKVGKGRVIWLDWVDNRGSGGAKDRV